MGTKKAGGGKAKKAVAAYDTTPEALGLFGMKLGELVRTPLGLSATVVGVRCEDPSNKETGRVWVRYNDGHEAPLEPRPAAGGLSTLGYHGCAEADTIRAAVALQEAEAAKHEAQRLVVEEVKRLLAAGEAVPPHLVPASMREGAAPAKKGGKDEKGDKEKKKKKG